jgi:hypothetical protein
MYLFSIMPERNVDCDVLDPANVRCTVGDTMCDVVVTIVFEAIDY